MFLDVERVSGNLKSQPFSVGLIAVWSDSGIVVEKKQIVIMPEEGVKVDQYASK